MQNDSTKDDDSSLFREAMDDVEPLKDDNRVRHKPARKNVRVRQQAQANAIEDIFSDAPVEPCPDQLGFARDGVQPATLKKLRQGKLQVDNQIDLHGMTVDQARNYLMDFLGECEADGSRVVMHFQGTPQTLAARIMSVMMVFFVSSLRRMLQADAEELAREAERRAQTASTPAS